MEGEKRGAGTDAATKVFVVVVLLMTVALGFRYFFVQWGARPEARKARCRSNLNQLARGMWVYLDNYGDCRFYPFPLGQGLEPDDFGGDEWLAALYWTGSVLPDPGCFICPDSGDTNHNGEDLGSYRAVRGRFGSQTVSYAALHYKSLTDAEGNPKGGVIRDCDDDERLHEPMACDDTEGTINHGQATNGHMNILFFDGRVEVWPHTKIDLEHGVGMKGGPLWRLRN